MLQLTTLTDLTCCFCYFEADNLPNRKYCFLNRDKNSDLMFHPRLFICVKAWYFNYGKCSIVDVRANLYGNH